MGSPSAVSNTPPQQGSKVEDGAVVEYNCDEGYRHKDVAYYTCDPSMPEDQRTPVCESTENYFF